MIKGTVESISKTSIVVTVDSAAKTLTGTAVEALAPTVKLGDVVEFNDDVTTIRIVPKEKAKQATQRSSSSPAAAFVGKKLNF